MSDNQSAEDIVVTATRNPQPKEWGYDIVSYAPDGKSSTSQRIHDKSATVELPSDQNIGVTKVHLPHDARLELNGSSKTDFIKTNTQAGSNLEVNAGGGRDHFIPSITPATTQEQLAKYNPRQVRLNGGDGLDTVHVSDDTIITRLPDDKHGEHYRFTDKNGYAFDTTSVENVVNSSIPAPQAGRDAKGLLVNTAGTELNTLRLEPGHSMAVGEATRPLVDTRVHAYEAASLATSNSYKDKLAACLADKGDLNLCQDIKYTPPTMSDFGKEPTRTEHTGPMPTPKVVAAETGKPGATR